VMAASEPCARAAFSNMCVIKTLGALTCCGCGCVGVGVQLRVCRLFEHRESRKGSTYAGCVSSTAL
jgi:hypothetical protein